MTSNFFSAALRQATLNAIPLALFLVGPFYYYMAAHWFGMAHPAWMVGGYLALATLLLLPKRFNLLLMQLSAIDYLMLAFVLMVLFSLGMHGFPEKTRGIFLLVLYLITPYGAARLLSINEIGLFIKACMFLGWAAIPISFIELATMSANDLAQDRIRNFFGVFYSNNEAGLVLGLGLILCVITILRTEGQQNNHTFARYMAWAGLALSTGLLTFLSARGGLVASLCVTVILLFAMKPITLKTRISLLGVLFFSISISVAMLPSVRKVFIGQLITTPITKENINSELNKNATGSGVKENASSANPQPVSTDSKPEIKLGNTEKSSIAYSSINENKDEDRLKQRPKLLLEGNSLEIRLMEYRDALSLIANFPFFGVGAGKFGVYSPTALLLSNNALCIEEKRGMYVCPQSQFFSGPHSTILHVFAELGILGIMVYSAMLFLLAKGLYKAAKFSKDEKIKTYAWYLGGAWLFYLITDQFYGDYFLGFQFYLLTGCVAAFLANNQKRDPI